MGEHGAGDKVEIADAKSGVSHSAISPDGKWFRATRDGDFKFTLPTIEGRKVEPVERDIVAFRFDGSKLKDTGQRIKLNGRGAAIRAADKPGGAFARLRSARGKSRRRVRAMLLPRRRGG